MEGRHILSIRKQKACYWIAVIFLFKQRVSQLKSNFIKIKSLPNRTYSWTSFHEHWTRTENQHSSVGSLGRVVYSNGAVVIATKWTFDALWLFDVKATSQQNPREFEPLIHRACLLLCFLLLKWPGLIYDASSVPFKTRHHKACSVTLHARP